MQLNTNELIKRKFENTTASNGRYSSAFFILAG